MYQATCALNAHSHARYKPYIGGRINSLQYKTRNKQLCVHTPPHLAIVSQGAGGRVDRPATHVCVTRPVVAYESVVPLASSPI